MFRLKTSCILILLFSFFIFAKPQFTNAVDQFGCKWYGTECHIGLDQCGAGWHSDDSVCSAIHDADLCNRTTANCIQNADVKKWKCGSGPDLGNCIPADPSDPLAVFSDSTCGNTCKKPISTPGWKCDTTTHTCTEDANSSTTLLDCTNSCNNNTTSAGEPGCYDKCMASCTSGNTCSTSCNLSCLNQAGLNSPGGWLGKIDLKGLTIPQGNLSFVTGNIVPFVINLLLFLVIVLSLIFLIIGGIMWMVSRGEKEGLAKAKSTVTYAIIGLALGLGSFIILNILGTFFGINLTGP